MTFNAAPWFAQASNEAIRDLAAIDWGGSYESDRVAEFCEDLDPQVADMFVYQRTAHRVSGIGFECHVDPMSALAWLAIHRPALHKELEAALYGDTDD